MRTILYNLTTKRPAVPGPMRMSSDSRMSANSVVLKWTVLSTATGIFMRISFWNAVHEFHSKHISLFTEIGALHCISFYYVLGQLLEHPLARLSCILEFILHVRFYVICFHFCANKWWWWWWWWKENNL